MPESVVTFGETETPAVRYTGIRRYQGRRRPRKGVPGRDTIRNRVDISQRPEEVEATERIGDWEGQYNSQRRAQRNYRVAGQSGPETGAFGESRGTNGKQSAGVGP